MANILTKLSDNTVSVLDTDTNVRISYTATRCKWGVHLDAPAICYVWYEDQLICTVSDDPSLYPGSSILGNITATTAAAALNTDPLLTSSASGGTVGVVSINATDIGLGVDASVDIDTMLVRLTEIRNELQTSKSIADLLVEDSSSPTARVFIRQELYNDTTNTSTVVFRNLDGTVPAPAPVLPFKPLKSATDDYEFTEVRYRALVARPGSYGVGEQVTRTQVYVNGVPTSVFFTRDTDNTVITAVIAELEPLEAPSVAILRNIDLYTGYQRTETYYKAQTNLPGQWAIGDVIAGIDVRRGDTLVSSYAVNLVTGLSYTSGAPYSDWKLLADVGSDSADIVPAGSSGPLVGGRSLLVTVDANSRPVGIDVTKNTGPTDSDTIRTVTSDDSPDYLRMFDGFQQTQINDSVNTLRKVRVLQDIDQSNYSGVDALMIAPTVTSFIEKRDYFVATANFLGAVIGDKLVRVTRRNPDNGAGVVFWYSRVSDARIATVLLANVTLDVSTAFAEPNQTLATSAFTRVGNGTITVDVFGSSTSSTLAQTSLSIQNSPNNYFETTTQFRAIAAGALLSIGNVFTRVSRYRSDTGVLINQRYTRTSDGLDIPASDLGIVGATNLNIPTEPNQTLTTAAFTKLTDGVDSAEILPASTDSTLTNTSLVTQTSPNSYYEKQTLYRANATGALIAGQDLFVKVSRFTSSTGLLIFDRYFRVLDSLNIPSTDLGLVGATNLEVPIGFTEPNQTIFAAGHQKITDGTNIAAVKAPSVSPALTDRALVVAVSGNSPYLASLAPSTIATRHALTGGQYLAADPTLTNAQQAPLGLTASGYLKTASLGDLTWGALTPNTTATQAALGAARFLTTPPILTNGQVQPLLINATGALVVSSNAGGTIAAGSIAPAPDTILIAGKKLYRIVFTNTSASTIFVQLHNNPAALPGGAVPLNGHVYRVPTNATFVLDETTFSSQGELVAANLHIAFSSAFGTYTAASGANLALCSLNYKIEA